ncbi:MAG: hypothetical protein AAFX46_01875 [Cyanobacteria bacterium J06636_27]
MNHFFINYQDLRNEDLSLRPERSVGKQSQKLWDYVAFTRSVWLIARNDGITLILRKS